jgi:spore germination cell wall hydrolase CwlJ-like protein
MRLIEDWIWGVITVWHEAQGESFKGKVMVAEVILNRTKRKHRSDGTVAGTVLWPVQFSGWNAHDATPKYRERIEGAKLDTNDTVVQDCIRAWKEAEAGSNYVKGGMDYYNHRICSPDWAKGATVLAEEGNHRFVIPKGG